jgi:hypothetical protein
MQCSLWEMLHPTHDANLRQATTALVLKTKVRA